MIPYLEVFDENHPFSTHEMLREVPLNPDDEDMVVYMSKPVTIEVDGRGLYAVGPISEEDGALRLTLYGADHDTSGQRILLFTTQLRVYDGTVTFPAEEGSRRLTSVSRYEGGLGRPTPRVIFGADFVEAEG